jgi:hypothetical protein
MKRKMWRKEGIATKEFPILCGFSYGEMLKIWKWKKVLEDVKKREWVICFDRLTKKT